MEQDKLESFRDFIFAKNGFRLNLIIGKKKLKYFFVGIELIMRSKYTIFEKLYSGAVLRRY